MSSAEAGWREDHRGTPNGDQVHGVSYGGFSVTA
jgi:hypothetical protein